ncbi:MAG: hypothetical protein ABFS35_23200, partial [Bacteroidota bacterium]
AVFASLFLKHRGHMAIINNSALISDCPPHLLYHANCILICNLAHSKAGWPGKTESHAKAEDWEFSS